MMRHLGISMEVTCNTSEVLGALVKNRAQHAEMVKEAQAGYVEKAKVALQKRLGELIEGKCVSVAFALAQPIDHTSVYDTAIHMLQRHTSATVTLGADEFRHLVDDEWEWLDHFLEINSSYSSSTRAFGEGKGRR